jgi:hypothetical protein
MFAVFRIDSRTSFRARAFTHFLMGVFACCAGVGATAQPNPQTTLLDRQLMTALKIECALQPSAAAAGALEGSCEIPCSVNALAVNFAGVDAKRACSSAPRKVKATLAKTATPNRWLGTMEGVQPEDPTRFEVVPDKTGGGAVGRLPYGWFRVTENQQVEKSVRITFDANQQVRPTTDDLAILDRAVMLIPSADVWNKNDNRECPAEAKKLSLFCALMQASNEISGGVHYRQPAMQAVREELNLVDKSRINKHRIMDYNNHADTTLHEIHGLLQRAKGRVNAEIKPGQPSSAISAPKALPIGDS